MNTPTQQSNKKGAREAIIGISITVIVTIGILFAQRYFATEIVIARMSTEMDGKPLIVQLSEKKGSYRHKEANSATYQTNNSHYGYSLKLIDSVSHAVLDVYKFSSPVDPVQSEPQITMINKTLWLVSEMPTIAHDDNGYVLKFEIQNNKIVATDFKLDEKYKIRELKDGNLYLTEGNDLYNGSAIMVFGGLYFDLATEKIVVVPKMH